MGMEFQEGVMQRSWNRMYLSRGWEINLPASRRQTGAGRNEGETFGEEAGTIAQF